MARRSSPSTLPAAGRRAVPDPDALQALLGALLPENKNQAERERAFKALLALAARRPDLLLPRWDELTRMLRRCGAFTKWPAIYLIAALLPADRRRRFDRSFAAYFNLLDDEAVSVAAHTARLAARVVAARPDLEPRVTRRLLALDRTHFDPDRRDLVKSYALEAMGTYVESTRSRRAIRRFAEGMLASSSPRAVRTARAFLKKYAGAAD
ncbi:MAG: hypothetical protein FJZ97_12845 [Chloroflexi bacterium]|nr:hypothetical protein [Chloroflexota bacterium]